MVSSAAQDTSSSAKVDPLPCSFHTLHRHSIFQPIPSHQPNTEPQFLDRDDLVSAKRQRLAIRDKEIIVAIGQEVRLANLSGNGFEIRNEQVGKYSTLTSSALSFDILSLTLNPTGRLLAVVGRSQLVVLSLPRPGSSTRGEVAVRSIVIDAPQYSASSSTGISKVLWHPLGQNGESLWVLSADGQLREYDIQSPHDPVQTYAFLPPQSSGSRFSAIDPLSLIATSFTFGPSAKAGWAECAIYGLLANGDLYTLCPVIPFRTEVPLKYVQRLKAYVGQRGTEAEGYWLDNLTRQIRLEDTNAISGSRSPEIKKSVLGRSTMMKQTAEKGQDIDPDQMVLLHPPHLTPSGGPAKGVHMELERQGPVVYDPALEELEGDEENVAVDMVLLAVGAGEEGSGAKGKGKSEGKGKGEVRVLGICWSSGRVDIGVEVERVQGKWAEASGSKAERRAVSTIPIIESIQLDVPARLISGNAPSFSTDPIHPDTFYVQHSAGVDAMSVLNMVSGLLAGKGDIPSCDVAQLVSTTKSKPQPIEGLVACYNFSLGYGILALGPSNRLAAVELDYRTSDNTDPPPAVNETVADEPTTGIDHSLITAQPLYTGQILFSLRPPTSLAAARSALKKLPTANKAIDTIGAEHLRAIGDLISNLQSRIEALRTASQTVERHLDLQTREFQRQVQLLQTSATDLEGVKKHDAVSRAERMLSEQGRLAGRMDKVLSGLTGLYRPPVGEVERAWFDKLEGLRKAVQGSEGFGVYSGGGLQGQVADLEEELEDIRPSVRSLNEEASATSRPLRKAGAREIRPLESALYHKMDEIGQLMRKMDGLKMQVEEALGHQC